MAPKLIVWSPKLRIVIMKGLMLAGSNVQINDKQERTSKPEYFGLHN